MAAAALAWTVVAVLNLIAGPPLGHDEAAFAILARGDTVSWLYRSRGVTVLAELGVALGGAEWQLRLASAIVGLAVVPAVYAVGRAAFSARTGAWAAAVIASAHPMVARNTDLLGDLPATAGLLAGVAVLTRELERAAGPRWRIVLAAPAFAAAFYARYGSAPVIAIAGVAALVLWWRPIRARPAPILATAVVFAVLLIPHVLHSLHATGEVLGVLLHSSTVPRLAYPGEGLVGYLTSNPLVYYGVAVAPVLVAALVGLVRTLRGRPAWFLASCALGQLVVLGIQSHAQPRYVFIAAALLVVLGVEALRPLNRPRLALGTLAAAWLGIAIAIVPYDRAIAHSRGAILAAATAIRADRKWPACVVVAGTGPQLTWYTQCELYMPVRVVPSTLSPGRDRYVVATPYVPLDGPAIAAAHGLTAVELPTGDDRTHVWALR